MPPEMPELAGVRHSYVDVNGFRCHVAEAGDPEAPPVVMLHGWPQHWWSWRKLIPRFADSYRVVCPDLRGHGWSDAPPSGYDKPQFAKDLIATLDALGIERTRLIGHDWGGIAGFLACLRHPERIERYVALSIPPPFPTGELSEALGIWRLWYQIPLTTPVIAPRLVGRPEFIRFVLQSGLRKRDAMSRADIDLYARAIAERPHVTLAIYRTFITREAWSFARGHWAGRLTVPTRLMIGDGELVVSVDSAIKGAARYADDMRVHEVKGAGHFLPEEAPDTVAEQALSLFA